MDELCRRHWPGNIRQLRHAVEHGMLLARGGPIGAEHLPPEAQLSAARSVDEELDAAIRQWTQRQIAADAAHGDLYQDFLSRVESPLFETVLHRTAGNRAAAADALGIHRATLRKKLGGGEKA
jgi:two-component system nitrogen regulation response regulator GlnG